MTKPIFPELPGQAWPRVRLVQTATTVKRANGRRYALSTQRYPTYVYRLNYAYLREADFATLAGFFRARAGRAEEFWFNDRDDNSTNGEQLLGLGNGTNTAFEFVRSWGGVTEPVGGVNGVPVIKVGGTTLSGAQYTITDNILTLAAAPGAGVSVTWSGLFYWNCAFLKDEAEFTEFLRHLRTARTVEFETCRP